MKGNVSLRSAAGPPSTRRDRGGTSFAPGLADFAVLGTLVAVFGLFAISPVTLEARGIAYMTSGGGALSKVHPSTLIVMIAVALRCLATRQPLVAAWRLVTSDTGVVLLLVAVAVAGFCAVAIDKTPVTPLIDTFVLPILIFLMLRDLDVSIVRWLAIAIMMVMCANAIIALVEFLRGWHLVSIDVPAGASADPRRGDATFDWRAELALDWRATALLGHPLSNGLIVGGFILCLAAAGSRWIPLIVKMPLLALQSVSMFAFGARTALVLTIVFGGWLGFAQGVEAIGRGARLSPRQILVAALAICLLIAAGALIFETGFLDKTIERFQNDGGSATTRITMFNLFQPLSTADMLFKPDSDVVATWQRLEGLEFGIESSWIGLALIYGLLVTAMLVGGVLTLCWSVIRLSGRGALLVILLYLILASVSATMSGKTTTFATMISLVMALLRQDERPDPLWSAPRIRSAFH